MRLLVTGSLLALTAACSAGGTDSTQPWRDPIATHLPTTGVSGREPVYPLVGGGTDDRPAVVDPLGATFQPTPPAPTHRRRLEGTASGGARRHRDPFSPQRIAVASTQGYLPARPRCRCPTRHVIYRPLDPTTQGLPISRKALTVRLDRAECTSVSASHRGRGSPSYGDGCALTCGLRRAGRSSRRRPR